ncbi:MULTISPECIES: NAD(P)/FAD-dependent oxidoreductase [unclassified Achromobacter]|uniref:FAD/NAD(P)-dependent oxidoreductase n=1 Tax=unclassified Achromobacter TaxID=2626865 RepID=UPI000B516F25|nr:MULTISPECIES: FAD/NAD(P)-binding oxidoreductase [unclassified Achromobacter]OWT75086.1 FAD/NAD(P)-binding oxidoreductase [Achromobacter sp. HZ28]OWT76783.1 FAD/NAD(P)-binding oxidoreductase [Achromobacter sp. HZ34]
MQDLQPVIIGAGPAGIRAAQALVAAGLRPIVLDESLRAGGQIYRQPPAAPGYTRTPATLYGFEHRKATRLHRLMAQLAPSIDYEPGSLVWNLADGVLDVMRDGSSRQVPYRHLIIATGATDRVLPMPGWLTPGVYTLGGAQVALKYQGCAIGSRVVFMGTGPLLYLVAYQYAKAGAHVAAVLDTARFKDRLVALPGLLRAPVLLAKGLYYMAWLRRHGVTLHEGVRPLRVVGDTRVEAVEFQAGTQTMTVACDALGFGLGLRSETQLASLAGCRYAFNARDRAWLPTHDAAGRSSVAGVYLAGDGAGIAGADAAELSGERAALALLQDMGRQVDPRHVRSLDGKLLRWQRIRDALERAFPFPDDWAAGIEDDVMVCRCEEISAGTLRASVAGQGTQELNRLKALTRVGMGRCQGRMCGAAAAEVLAHACGVGPDQVGRLRPQPPVKPIPIHIVMMATPGTAAAATSSTPAAPATPIASTTLAPSAVPAVAVVASAADTAAHDAARAVVPAATESVEVHR